MPAVHGKRIGDALLRKPVRGKLRIEMCLDDRHVKAAGKKGNHKKPMGAVLESCRQKSFQHWTFFFLHRFGRTESLKPPCHRDHANGGNAERKNRAEQSHATQYSPQNGRHYDIAKTAAGADNAGGNGGTPFA